MAVDEDDLTRLFSSATLVLAGTALGSFSKLIERVVIARWLSKGAYGEVTLALAVMQFSVTLSLVGFNQGVPRFVSRYDSDADVRGVWLAGLLIALAVSLCLAAAVWLFDVDPFVRVFFDGESADRLLRLFMLSLPFFVGTTVAIGTIRGLENTIYKTYSQDLFLPLARIGVLVALLTAGLGVFAAGYAYVLASAAAFAFSHLLLNRLIPLVGEVRTHVRELVAFSAPLIVATVLSRLLTWTDTLMLGAFRSSDEVGLYGAAYPLANSLVVLFGAFGFIYLPLASRLDADDERGEVAGVFQLTTKWIVIGTFPAFLALAVFPGDVIGIVFGGEYTGAATALTILAVGFFTHAAAGRNRETISALGYTKYIFLSNAVGLTVNVALNLVLIPAYGIVGAAIASALSYALLNAFVNAILKLQFDISAFSSEVVRTLVLLPLTLIPPAYLLSRWVDLSLYTLPAVLVGAGVAAVAVVSVGGALQREDRILVEMVESGLGRPVPVLRRYLPD